MGTEYWRSLWKKCKSKLQKEQWENVLDIIHTNIFNEKTISDFADNDVRNLLRCYVDFRKDIITEGTDLFVLKCEYDMHPIRNLRRKMNTR